MFFVVIIGLLFRRTSLRMDKDLINSTGWRMVRSHLPMAFRLKRWMLLFNLL